MAAGASGLECLGGKFIESECRDCRGAAEPRHCRVGCMQEFAIGAENRDRPGQPGKKTAEALAKRQRGAGRFAGGNQYRGPAVGQHDARAGADDRSAQAGANAAQPFEALLPGGRKRHGEARDLSRQRIVRREPYVAVLGDAGDAENCRADGVRPQQARCVGAPKPNRPRARRFGRKSRNLQIGELGLDTRHAAEPVPLRNS